MNINSTYAAETAFSIMFQLTWFCICFIISKEAEKKHDLNRTKTPLIWFAPDIFRTVLNFKYCLWFWRVFPFCFYSQSVFFSHYNSLKVFLLKWKKKCLSVFFVLKIHTKSRICMCGCTAFVEIYAYVLRIVILSINLFTL